MPARRLLALGLALLLIARSAPAAGPRYLFEVPAGQLSTAIATVAREAGIDVGGIDPALARIASPGLSGRMTTTAAFERLLAQTPFAAEAIAPGVYRLVRRPSSTTPPRLATRSAAPPKRPASPPQDASGEEIVIRGAKRDVALSSYPGSAIVLLPQEGTWRPRGSSGQDYLLRQTPILQATELGSGRNKIFIRGIADSSFSGPTQSTASSYFGDVRIGYNGPDPNLNLYDVDRVEILEGPQGALYGAGSIGGIIRLSPHLPELDGEHGSGEAGISSTAHGGIGYDVAAMLNVAPLPDRLGIRLVAYRSRDAGYIDDPARAAKDVNRLIDMGVRASVRLRPVEGLTIDAGAIFQESHQPDLQYAMTEGPPLTRRSALPQPFDDRYTLASVVVTKRWDSGLSLVSATGRVLHDIHQRYDATRPGRFALPVAYDEQNTIRLTTQEVRLSRELAGGRGWLVGASYVHDTTAKAREFGFLASQRDLIGVTNRTEEKAVFANTTQAIGALTLTGGARYTHARMDGDPSASARSPFIRGRSSSRFDPQLGLSLRLAHRLAAFAQYQQGFRTGGLAVAPGVGRVANFADDQIRVGEAGLRLLRHGSTGVAAMAAISYASWRHIQADLVSLNGFPYTANVGNGRVLGLESSVDWVPLAGLRVGGGLFVNRSRLVDPAPDFAASGDRPLPDTPPVAATASASWTRQIGGAELQLAANARYLGRARLGVGPVLDLPYGDYLVAGAGATLRLRQIAFTLTVDNIADTRGNRFAIGNPFGIALRDEVTPLRPRTIRLGAATRF